jgi:hypothetical protein
MASSHRGHARSLGAKAGAEEVGGPSPQLRRLLLIHLVALGPALILGLALTNWDTPYAPRAARAERRAAQLLVRESAPAAQAVALTPETLVQSTAHPAPRRQLETSASSGSGSGAASGSTAAGSDAGSGSGSGSGEGGHSEVHLPASILATFATLAAGGLIMQLFSRFAVPYTVILLGLGMLVGLALLLIGPRAAGDEATRTLIDAAATWSDLDAHVMLHIFLPPLVFESAFAMEWRVFNQMKSARPSSPPLLTRP